jgi:hypothetical protein
MNPLDPFGRMKARQEKEYASLRDSLKGAGITSPAQAEALIASAQQKGNWSVAIGIMVATLLALLFPEAGFLFITLGAFFVFWVIKMIRSGQKYTRRYIDEELKG